MMTHILSNLHGVLGDLYSPVMNVIKIIGILILAVFTVKIGSLFIRKIFEKQKGFKYNIGNKKLDTMSSIIVSIYRYTVYIVAVVTILAAYFNMGPVLAAAGVGGIAIGLGAQSLIKDIISGFFIVLEDQYVVGDLITIENMTGIVEEMELRISKLRNFNGDLYTIPNGEIKKVTNHTRGSKAAIVDIPLAYSVDIDKVITAANKVCKAAAEEFEKIVEAPKVQGITEFGKETMNLRIVAKTLPNEQWEVERRIRKLIKDEFSKDMLDLCESRMILR
jgi:moderate conductance mechanosensitive channel